MVLHGALVVMVLLRGCGTGISFVKILRARDNNFEGSECSLRGLGRSEARASRGKTQARPAR